MNPLGSDSLKGNWGTLLLPINADDSIDFGRLEEEVGILCASSVNGIYCNGTAGEFFNQTEEEFDKISALLAGKCESADVPFQIGVSQTSPIVSLERIKRTKCLNPGAFQVILPDWLLPDNDEILRFLEKIGEAAAPIGLVLYNPPHAKRVLEPEDYGIIERNVSSLIGIKVADGDELWYEKMKEYVKRLSVFVPGSSLATGISRGVASGAYSNVACLSPMGAQCWYELMQENLGQAIEVENIIQLFLKKHILPYKIKYSNAALDKFMAVIGNWAPVGTRLRWPGQGIPNEDAVRLRKAAIKELPKFFKISTKEIR